MKKSDIKALSKILYFNLNEDELESIYKESDFFLKQVSYLDKVNVENTEMMHYPFEDAKSYLREDVVSHVLSTQAALENAPMREDDYFEVVRVIDK